MFARSFTFLRSSRRPAFARVRVFHSNDFRDACITGYRAEHTMTEVFAYAAVAPHTEAEVSTLLEQAFHLFNVGHDPDFGTPDERAVAYRQRRYRSLSVGDVVGVGNSFYACDRFGWRALAAGPRIVQHEDWDTTPLDEVSSASATRSLGELLRRGAVALTRRFWRNRGR